MRRQAQARAGGEPAPLAGILTSAALIRYIDALDYNMYWHTPTMYSPSNYAGNAQNAFGTIVSINMLCYPKSLPQQIVGGTKVEVPASNG